VRAICVSDPYVAIDLLNGFLLQLRSSEENPETLCNVDTTLVRSLQDCVIAHPGTLEAAGSGDMTSELTIYVAQEWQDRGESRRADELYQHYFTGYGARWLHWWYRGDRYCEWTRVKRALGDWAAAKELAGRCVAHGREMYDCDRNFLDSLVRALELQVDILDEVQDTKKAEQVREDLNHFRAIAEDDCIDGVCRGSPRFDGICWRHLTEKK
jgi:hypothetical protein